MLDTRKRKSANPGIGGCASSLFQEENRMIRLTIKRLGILPCVAVLMLTLILVYLSSSSSSSASNKPLRSGLIREDTSLYVNCDSSADLQCAIEELARVRGELRQMRVRLGKLVCSMSDNAVGDTGGYCLAVQNGTGKIDHVGDFDQYNVDGPLLQWLVSLLDSSEVVEFGCGVGHYGKALQEANKSIQWIGYDGAFNVEELTKGYVHWMDLSRPNWVGRKFDWVICLEVGEHIPAVFENEVIENIGRHAKKGTIISWAVPGQGGVAHVNVRPNEYIISKFKRLGFEYNAGMSDEGRQAASHSWFKNTFMVFENQGT